MTIHRFEAKRFIVTGAADGIGRATAARLIQEGGQVAMLDLAGDKVDTAAKELGDSAKGFTVDIADEAAVQATFAEALDWLGGLD